MSNWRINFGLGPLRYTRAVGGKRRKPEGQEQKMTPLGCLITLVVVAGLVYLCCTGGVWWMNRSS